MTLLVVIAMRAEARPVIERLGLAPVDGPTSWPQIEWHTDPTPTVVVATNGVDPIHGVDAIGTDSAAITTLLSIERWQPTLVISAGTAGGFIARGGHIGQIVLAEGDVIHHDRRIPLGAFDAYARGDHPCIELGSAADDLGFTRGAVSTGNSLDAPEHDLIAMNEHGTVAKDMEAAAVAGVAARTGTPFTALKVITDLVDGPHPTADEFVANLEIASARLADAVPALVRRLSIGPG